MRPIETRRLLIRPFRKDDWRDLYAYASNLEVWHYMASEPFTRDDARRYVGDAADAHERTDLLNALGVELKASGHLVGHISFQIYNAAYRTREVGWVFSPFHHGQGLATEAASAVLGYGFESLNLHRVVATCDTRNIASYRVMEKLGMRREAHFVKNVLNRGEWCDEYFYAILDEEWRESGPA